MNVPVLSHSKHVNQLHKLLDIGIALAAEQNHERLLEIILVGAKDLTNSDGGTLYTVTSDKKLHFEIVRTDSLKTSSGEAVKFAWGGKELTDADKAMFPDIPIFDNEGRPHEKMVSVYSYIHGCTVNVQDIYKTDLFDFSGTREFDRRTGYHSHSILTVPLKNQKKEIIGILQLLNAKDETTGEVIPFSKEDQHLVEYFASIAAIAMTNQNLVHESQGMSNALQRVLGIGVALSAERDHDRLLEMILESAKDLTNADGGTLYTVTSDKKLHFEIIRTDSLNLKWGGTLKTAPTAVGKEGHSAFTDIPLYDSEGKPNDRMIAVYSVIRNCTVNIPDAYDSEHFDFSGTRKFDATTGYRSQSFLTIPLKNHEQEIIGVLQLLNARDKTTGRIVPFSKEDQHLVESFASQAAIAMTNERLILELRMFFESLIKVLADAIDEKSPITGRHCKRVPIIADMLAKAVSVSEEGPYKNIVFTPNELYELNIAALLHDCGKVVTPVHVVEKSKKLETIIDRIELVNLRLEILKRDSQIQTLEEKLAIIKAKNPELWDGCKAEFAQIDQKDLHEQETLLQERAFLHECNRGMESMPTDWQQKLSELASRTWQAMDQTVQPFLSEDELKNLLISRGTLTEEERKIIQYHVVMTMKMLKQIPYPKYLREVPEIAGKHHEWMDGKGYPLGLTGDQMSLRARILAIADVFEALTAPDRPYKDCLPLSIALKILDQMKREGHIDPELYDVFVKQKVYLQYAQEHLQPNQIDVN